MIKLEIPDTLALKIEIMLYIIIGGMVGLIYGLKRALMLERKIVSMDRKIAKLLERKR